MPFLPLCIPHPGLKTLKFLLGTFPLREYTVSRESLIKCHGCWQRANNSNSAMQTPFVNVGRIAPKCTVGPDSAAWQWASVSLHFLLSRPLEQLWLLSFLKIILSDYLLILWTNSNPFSKLPFFASSTQN